MAWETAQRLKITRVAAIDLTGDQFRFVKITTGGDGDRVTICHADADVPIGVLQNNPHQYEEAEILVMGVTKIVGNATMGLGDIIGPTGGGSGNVDDGKAAARAVTDTSDYVVGQVLEPPGDDGVVGVAAIDCTAPARAA